MSDVQILRPDVPTPAPPPRWPVVALAISAVAAAVSALVPGRTVEWISAAVVLPGFVGVAVLALRLEDRWYHAASRRSLGTRLALGALTPPCAVLATALVLVLLAAVGLGGGGAFPSWLRNSVGFAGLWFAGASVGSTVILVINEGVSRLVKGFRARVTAAVLALLALSALVNALVLLAAMASFGAIAASGDDLTLSIGLGGTTYTGAEAKRLVLDHPAWTGAAWFTFAFVLTLPVALAASWRLADAVMERLRPLAKALTLAGQGSRAVRVEEAGSTDFIEVNRRFNEMVAALDRTERMERAFGVYVSGHVLERIRAQHGEAVIPASLREASVFFADIRGFTALSEKLSPEQVVAFLNRYFARVVALVDRHDGYLNKFIGDAVVVVFNGPVDQPDHSGRALRCAVALQALVHEMNAAHEFPEVGELKVGVGVATGPMVCGNIGGAQQMEYTVIGDTVNLAARLTSHAGPGEVWASEATVAALPEGLAATPLEPIKVKGKEKPVLPYRVGATAARDA